MSYKQFKELKRWLYNNIFYSSVLLMNTDNSLYLYTYSQPPGEQMDEHIYFLST